MMINRGLVLWFLLIVAIGGSGSSPAAKPLSEVENWLAEYPADLSEVPVYLVLESPPLAAFDAGEADVRTMDSRGLTREHLSRRIDLEQRDVRGLLPAVGAQEVHSFRVLANAVQVLAPRDRVAELAQLPGVVRVDPVGIYETSHTTSVPWVGAPQLWSGGLGLDGRDVRIGIIDSGIDYFHAHLGGAGRVQDFQNNNPTTVAPGTFPTAKVVGGWDFAGDDYHAGSPVAARRVPRPDPDPVDCGGHGTHVAGTAAGQGVLLDGSRFDGPYYEGLDMAAFRIGPGVAPAALLYAYKVFGCEGSTALVGAALERSADPNQDGDTSDRLDVVNMSLGCQFACSSPTEMAMVANLSALGTVVVASAGNSGDVFFIAGSPASAPAAVSVAATYDDGIVEPAVEVVAPEGIAGKYAAVEGAFTRPISLVGTVQAGVTAAQPADACSTLTNAASLAGRIALIDRGQCRFDEKIVRARNAGAVAVVMANNVDESPIVMGGDIVVDIPGFMISRADGGVIREHLAGGVTVRLAPDMVVGRPELADQIAGFSSRGPAQSGTLVKPDLAAPGVAIRSAAVGSGSGGAAASGTSMAAPHVAGAAALVRQLHPDWDAPQIKALLMNHAAPAVDGAGNPYSVSRVGAGRLALAGLELSDVTASVVGQEGEVILGFGLVEAAEHTSVSRTVRVTNPTGSARDLTVSVHPDPEVPGVSVAPESGFLSVPAGGHAETTVTMEVTPEHLLIPADPTTSPMQAGEVRHRLPEVRGKVRFESVGAGRSLSVPYHAVVRSSTKVRTAVGSVCLPEGLSSINLPVVGAVGHPEPLVALFQLGRETTPTGATDPLRSAADVLAVGAASDYAATGSLASSTLFFAVATAGDWPAPQPELVRFEVLLDLTGNAEVDWELSTWTYGHATAGSASDTFVVMLRNPQTGVVTTEGLANFFRADELDLPPFFTNVLVLPVRASSLGLAGSSGPLDYYVRSFVRGAQVKSLGRGRFDPRQPQAQAADPGVAGSPFLHLDHTVSLQVDPTAGAEVPGALLLYPHNIGPQRWQVVPLQEGPGARLQVEVPDDLGVPLGGSAAVQAMVRNHGPERADEAVLRASLPEQVAVVSAIGPAGDCTVSDGSVVCPLGNVSVGEDVGVDLVLTGLNSGAGTAAFWLESRTCHPAPPEGAARLSIGVDDEPTVFATAVIPSVARLQGVGAFFTSRAEIYNAGTSPLDVEVVYTPRRDIPGPVRHSSVTVPPQVQLEVEDPLQTWFGISDDQPAAGTLGLTVTAGRESDLIAQSVVYARNPDGSEFGQFFPAMRSRDAIRPGRRAYLATTVDASRNRVNLGIVGLAEATTVEVVPVDPLGTPLAASRSYLLNSGDSRQINDLNHGNYGFSLGDRSDYLVQLDVVDGAAQAFVSVLDGTAQVSGTSDPTTILPVVTGSARQTLVGLGPVTGLNEFAGSASITNLDDGPAVIRADFFARDDGQSGVGASASLVLDAGETRGFVDMVGELFDIVGVGVVVLSSESESEFFATGREYAVFRDIHGHVTGTAGQLVPGFADADTLWPGLTYHILGVRERTIGEALERTNLLIFNPGSESASVIVTLFDGATGRFEGQRTERVGPGEMKQVNRLVHRINPDQDGQTKRLEVVSDGAVFVTASRVNKDGDPVTLLPYAGDLNR